MKSLRTRLADAGLTHHGPTILQLSRQLITRLAIAPHDPALRDNQGEVAKTPGSHFLPHFKQLTQPLRSSMAQKRSHSVSTNNREQGPGLQ